MNDLIKLNNAPQDGISSVNFGPTSHLLLTVALHDVKKNAVITMYQHKGPVLDASFADATCCYSGGIDQTLKRFEFTTGKEMVLGTHDKAIRSVVSIPNNTALVATGGWDANVKIWDSRLPTNTCCIATIQQPGKVYAMDISPDATTLVIGTHGRHVNLYDIRNPNAPTQVQRRESSLKHQTRAIKCNTDSTGYAQSSIEGRVAIEYFNPSEEWQNLKYAFKCHRSTNTGVQTLYPVNTIAYHPKYVIVVEYLYLARFGTFATGGCDGIVNIWDGKNKKRIYQMQKLPSSVASLSFNNDGTLLAIASSYTFEMGDMPHGPDELYIRSMAEADVKPKSK